VQRTFHRPGKLGIIARRVKNEVVMEPDWRNETNEAVNLQVFTPDGKARISEETFEANADRCH